MPALPSLFAVSGAFSFAGVDFCRRSVNCHILEHEIVEVLRDRKRRGGGRFRCQCHGQPGRFCHRGQTHFGDELPVCHNPQHAEENGKFRLDTKEEAFKPHKKDQRIVPGNPDESEVYYLTVLPPGDETHMPPQTQAAAGQGETEKIRQWITEGASGPTA